MRLPPAAAAALLALAPLRAGATDAGRMEPAPGEGRVGAVLALRLGVAPAFGSAAADVPVSDAVGLQAPVQLDALVKYRRAAAGLYASRGWGWVDACDGSCGASVWRAGLQATWTFAPVRGAEPWAGVAAGYEWATASRAGAGREVETSWRGWEPFAAQGGVEWRVARAVALGPFVLLGLGRYTEMSVDTGLESASAPIRERAVHGWLHLGVRARLLFQVRP